MKLPYRGIATFKFRHWLYEDYRYLAWINYWDGKREWRTDILKYRKVGQPRPYKINDRAFKRSIFG